MSDESVRYIIETINSAIIKEYFFIISSSRDWASSRGLIRSRGLE